jgi:hypothetical protein
MLTSEQSAELEALGTASVRLKLFLFRRPRAEFVSGFKSGALKRSDVERWLAEKYAKKNEKVQGTKLLALIIAAAALGIAIAELTFWLE